MALTDMTMENLKIIIEDILKKLCDIYGRKLNQNLINFWIIGLEDYKPEEIVLAFKGYAKHNEVYRFPTPREFIKFARQPNPHPYC